MDLIQKLIYLDLLIIVDI